MLTFQQTATYITSESTSVSYIFSRFKTQIDLCLCNAMKYYTMEILYACKGMYTCTYSNVNDTTEAYQISFFMFQPLSVNMIDFVI